MKSEKELEKLAIFLSDKLWGLEYGGHIKYVDTIKEESRITRDTMEINVNILPYVSGYTLELIVLSNLVMYYCLYKYAMNDNFEANVMKEANYISPVLLQKRKALGLHYEYSCIKCGKVTTTRNKIGLILNYLDSRCCHEKLQYKGCLIVHDKFTCGSILTKLFDEFYAQRKEEV